MEMTGGEALAAQLVREGVSMVFGVPGVQLDHAFEGLYRERAHIQFRGPRHEQAATYMADGYARTRGEAGVAMVVPGPGVLNAAAGLATAYACSSPVLVIAGQILSQHIGKGLGLLHEIPDQAGILQSLTKWTGRATAPTDVPRMVREAFRQLHQGRPQPVALEIPPDVLAARANMELCPVDPSERDALRLAPDPGLVREAAGLLRGARRPVLYAGSGVLASHATAALTRLAERLQAPVVVSDNGRGALSDRHPLTLTTLAGRRVLPEADVILAVGARFVVGQGQVRETGARVILVNADPHDLGGPRRPEVAMLADARLALDALADELDGPPALAGPWARLDDIRREADAEVAAVMPQAAYVRALRSAIVDDGILVSELTQVGYVTRVGYPVYEPRTFITPGYQGTLGYGFPTALGVKAGLPDRAVVSITGDGGFGWGLGELATAKRYNLGLVTVVFDDRAFGNVKRTQKQEFGGHVLGTDLVNPDYGRLAEAFGIRGQTVNSLEALEPTLKEALQADEPCLIAVPVGEMASPWPLLMRRSVVAARP
jgi:acetolactate synthase-1/2/3 large subunit